MIINIRGTHGSGKSTLVRNVMGMYATVTPNMVDRRKQPFSYVCSDPGMLPLYIPGHYETPTGGCDTIPDATLIYETIYQAAASGMNVLYEGIVAQHSQVRLMALNREYPVQIIVLTTDVTTCIKSVQARRDEAGNTKLFSDKNLRKEFQSVQSSTQSLMRKGANIKRMSREEAFNFCVAALKVEP